MDRRSFVGRLLAVGSPMIAGCTEESRTPEAPAPNESPTPAGGDTESPPSTVTSTPTGGDTESPSSTPTPTATSGVVDVAAGPEGRLRFDPETVEIDVGDTVRWTFESAGHNVTTKPGSSDKVSIPDGAEPFASYEGDQHFAIVDVGETYEYTFTVPGEYVYVCAPHEDQGMVGTVVVSE